MRNQTESMNNSYAI